MRRFSATGAVLVAVAVIISFLSLAIARKAIVVDSGLRRDRESADELRRAAWDSVVRVHPPTDTNLISVPRGSEALTHEQGLDSVLQRVR